jgi:hypothetical protein
MCSRSFQAKSELLTSGIAAQVVASGNEEAKYSLLPCLDLPGEWYKA